MSDSGDRDGVGGMVGYPTIIAGPRDYFPGVAGIQRAIDASLLPISEVVCGMAPGVDSAGLAWAKATGTPWVPFPAPWRTMGAAAGPWRNREMARYCAARGGQLLALWDGQSRGTGNMIAQARALRLPLEIHWIHR